MFLLLKRRKLPFFTPTTCILLSMGNMVPMERGTAVWRESPRRFDVPVPLDLHWCWMLATSFSVGEPGGIYKGREQSLALGGKLDADLRPLGIMIWDIVLLGSWE